MSKSKTRVAMAAALITLLLASTAVSFAFFSDTQQADNRLSVGYNEIKIQEDFTPPPTLEFDSDNRFQKKVYVTNTGNTPCYVRVFLDFSESEIKSWAKLSSSDLDGNPAYLSVADYNKNLPDGWVYQQDPAIPDAGWYYYTYQLEPGQSTVPLINSVSVQFPNAESVRGFEILVSSDSIQTILQNGSPAKDYADAWSQFLAN